MSASPIDALSSWLVRQEIRISDEAVEAIDEAGRHGGAEPAAAVAAAMSRQADDVGPGVERLAQPLAREVLDRSRPQLGGGHVLDVLIEPPQRVEARLRAELGAHLLLVGQRSVERGVVEQIAPGRLQFFGRPIDGQPKRRQRQLGEPLPSPMIKVLGVRSVSLRAKYHPGFVGEASVRYCISRTSPSATAQRATSPNRAFPSGG